MFIKIFCLVSLLGINKVWLVLFTAAIPVAAIGLALIDYKESGAHAEYLKSFLKAYMLYTLQTLLSQGCYFLLNDVNKSYYK